MRLDGMSWERYPQLSLQVYVDEPHDILLRIDDWKFCEAFESRYNGRFHLSAGWNELRIPVADVRNGPKNRALEVDELRRMLLFFEPAQRSESFIVDQIKLVNQ